MLQQIGFPWYVDFAKYLVNGLLPHDLSYQQKKRFLHDLRSYHWNEPYLYKMCSDNTVKRFVPDEKISSIFQSYHAAVYGVHFGGHKMATKVL